MPLIPEKEIFVTIPTAKEQHTVCKKQDTEQNEIKSLQGIGLFSNYNAVTITINNLKQTYQSTGHQYGKIQLTNHNLKQKHVTGGKREKVDWLKK